MRKLVVTSNVTLDGVIDPVEWSFQFFNDEHAKYAKEQLFASDALLLGRETYEEFASVWQSMTDEEGFADRMNALPKYVASTTLSGPLEWNASVIEGDLAEAVSRLKSESGEDILIYGCGGLARELTRHGLVDEIKLWVHPVVWGSGVRVFDGLDEGITLKLVDAKPLNSGVVIATYGPSESD